MLPISWWNHPNKTIQIESYFHHEMSKRLYQCKSLETVPIFRLSVVNNNETLERYREQDKASQSMIPTVSSSNMLHVFSNMMTVSTNRFKFINFYKISTIRNKLKS